MDALLKGDEIVSGGLVLEETIRCWLLLERESIFCSLPFRLENAMAYNPDAGFMMSLEV